MLGIGGTELVLILFFGFLIFGPEKLPEMGRTVGRAIRQFRAASDQVNAKFREEVYDPFQEAIDPYKSEIEEAAAPIKEDLDSINSTLKETESIFKDPLGLGDKRPTSNPYDSVKEARERDQAAKKKAAGAGAAGTTSGMKKVTSAKKAAPAKKAEPALSTPAPEPQAAAEPAAEATAKKATMADSLYGVSSGDGE